MNKVSVLWGLTVIVLFGSTGDDRSRVISTQTLPFSGKGAVQIENSNGSLYLEGWDRPEIEMTITKSAVRSGSVRNPDRIKQDLEGAHVSAERRGADILITTDLPLYSTFKPPLPGSPRVDLEYRIMVPRDTPVLLKHTVGEVYIEGLHADVQASVARGNIILIEPADLTHAIDARTKIGSVNSFAGGSLRHARWPLGNKLALEAGTSPKCVLRVGFGDIAIFKSYSNNLTRAGR